MDGLSQSISLRYFNTLVLYDDSHGAISESRPSEIFFFYLATSQTVCGGRCIPSATAAADGRRGNSQAGEELVGISRRCKIMPGLWFVDEESRAVILPLERVPRRYSFLRPRVHELAYLHDHYLMYLAPTGPRFSCPYASLP
ncbi:hypothetical protein F5X98DRAFT_336661 [Xylaria grammica]|nr:hypothetical protein F5X98DRAFT_336661 [Xylaria grammica]